MTIDQERLVLTTEGGREKLRQYAGKRISVYGELERFSPVTRTDCDGRRCKPILIARVTHWATNEILADHAWLPIPDDETIQAAWRRFAPGRRVYFDANVGSYVKGGDSNEPQRLDFEFKEISSPTATGTIEVAVMKKTFASNGEATEVKTPTLEERVLALSVDELRVLRFAIEKELRARQEEAANLLRVEVRAFALQKAKAAGISIDQIFPFVAQRGSQEEKAQRARRGKRYANVIGG